MNDTLYQRFIQPVCPKEWLIPHRSGLPFMLADWQRDTQPVVDSEMVHMFMFGCQQALAGTRQLSLGDGGACYMSLHILYQPYCIWSSISKGKPPLYRCCDKLMFWPCLTLAGKEAANPLNKWTNTDSQLALLPYLHYGHYCMWSISRAPVALCWGI